MADKKNELAETGWKIKKEKGEAALRIRLPGGDFSAEEMKAAADLAEKYGRGSVHITSRQGCEIQGIPWDKIGEVNRELEPFADKWRLDTETRNIMACIGNKFCRFGTYDTTFLSSELEEILRCNEFIVKIALSGCPNDCIKAHIQDIGILGQVEPIYTDSKCISCGICVSICGEVAGALSLQEKVFRDHNKCIGCGECAVMCPTGAMSKGDNYFKVLIMGRTGKKNPRLAAPFLSWALKDTVLKLCANINPFIARHIDRSLKKDRMGYIFDRTGYKVFKEEILRGIPLGQKTVVAENINFKGYTNFD